MDKKSDWKPLSESVSIHGSTSFALIREVKNAEPAAWERLVQLYTPLICYWCRQTGVPNDDVSDLTQEVFRSLSTAISRFHRDQEGDTFRGWLRTITRNKVRDYLRRQNTIPLAVGGSDHQRRMVGVEDDLANDALHDPQATVPTPFSSAVDLIRGEFEHRTWQAFWRTAVDGQKANDVAEELSMSHAAVRKAKSRVLSRIRNELSNPLDEDG